MRTVSIIIATSGRTPALRETLHSLASTQIPDGWRVELLLIENVTQTGAEEILAGIRREKFSSFRYLFEPLRGKASALNLAIGQASGEILLFTDDDVRFPPSWIERMCEPIVSRRVDAVAGGVRLAPHLLRPWMNHTHRAWLASTADYLTSDNPSEMCGANMAVSRRVFDAIAGFDPELGPGITGGGEESLLSWQINQAGFKLESALNVQLEHYLDPERLRYNNWLKAARFKGQTRAYHLHHWFHQELRLPWLRRLYLQAKLKARRIWSPRKRPDDEGMPPWEMSYVEEIAACAQFVKERQRPRNYSLRGLRKLKPERPPIAE